MLISNSISDSSNDVDDGGNQEIITLDEKMPTTKSNNNTEAVKIQTVAKNARGSLTSEAGFILPVPALDTAMGDLRNKSIPTTVGFNKMKNKSKPTKVKRKRKPTPPALRLTPPSRNFQHWSGWQPDF